MKSICIFCGSSSGNNDAYKQSALKLAEHFISNGIRLVFGGSKVGLMGEIANYMLSKGGNVIGVIPKSLVEREVAHDQLKELLVVDTMHERKWKMANLSDGFIAIPGGFGTLDEIFEMITFTQLGMHEKACAFYNTEGYFDNLLNHLSHSVKEGFIEKEYLDMLICEDNPQILIQKVLNFTPPNIDKATIALKKLSGKNK